MKKKNLQMFVLLAFCFTLSAVLPIAAQDVPNWAIGTFTAQNPQTGGTITLTIQGNGNVTVNLDGTINYGNYDDERLTINGVTSRVRKINNGIRTTRTDNGERIDYVRGGGNGGGGNVPNWAVGSFYATNPQNGETINLRIDSNGAVTVNFSGATNYGTLNGDRLTLNGVTSKVKKINRGIRTTRLDNGERIDYRKQ